MEIAADKLRGHVSICNLQFAIGTRKLRSAPNRSDVVFGDLADELATEKPGAVALVEDVDDAGQKGPPDFDGLEHDGQGRARLEGKAQHQADPSGRDVLHRRPPGHRRR